MRQVNRILGEASKRDSELAKLAVKLACVAVTINRNSINFNRLDSQISKYVNAIYLIASTTHDPRKILDFLHSVQYSHRFDIIVTCIDLLNSIKSLDANAITKLLKSDPSFPIDEVVARIDHRIPDLESLIASNQSAREAYLAAFPEAKDDWVLNGWLGWLDT